MSTIGSIIGATYRSQTSFELAESLRGVFWGFPAVIAATQVALGISGFAALVAISVTSSVAACLLIHRLYGGVVTVTFLILCPEWVRLSVIGGSEPLFLCLLLGSWLAFRSPTPSGVSLRVTRDDRKAGWSLCALRFRFRFDIATRLATTCDVHLHRRWGRAVYLELLQMVTGDPFINFRLYSSGLAFRQSVFVSVCDTLVKVPTISYWTGGGLAGH